MRALQSMSYVAKCAVIEAAEAIDDAKLPLETLQSQRAAVVVGTSFGGINEAGKAERLLRKHKNPLRLGVTGLFKGMHSTAAGNLASWLGVRGRAYSLCSSFSSGADAIGHAHELIARGMVDLCLCGSTEESTLPQGLGWPGNCGGL